MLRLRILAVAALACLALVPVPSRILAAAPAPFSARLQEAAGRPRGGEIHAWVYFRDKGLATPAERAEALRRAESELPDRTLWRRAKIMTGPVVDDMDLPVSGRHVREVRATGARQRQVSRWFNSMSVSATPAQLRAIAALPCVDRLDVVESYRRGDVAEGAPDIPANGWSPVGPGAFSPVRPAAPAAGAVIDSTQYGVTWKQLNLHQIPKLHDAGFHGEGVLICMLDSGFRTTHSAFNYPGHVLQVAHSRDFIHGDTVVANEAGQDSAGQDSHGTYCLSLIGGYYPGRYLGAAYNARFILGKTEWVPTETPIEEDHWLAGVEWADSLGADLISSSLGYSTYDTTSIPPLAIYAQMDGRTRVSSRAANYAAARGIVCITAMGNDGGAIYPSNKVIAPADGFNVVSAGATDSLGVRSSYSCFGPTWDRRIKPEVMARGTRDWVVSVSSDLSYFGTGSGTSFATPITAGAVALVLQKNPGYNPLQVLDALRQTASHPASPDTVTGYGLLRAYDAASFVSTSVDSGGGVRNLPGLSLAMSQNQPNPFRGNTRIDYSVSGVAGEQRVRLRVFDPAGRLVATLKDGDAAPGTHQAAWDGRHADGRPAGTGLYFYRLESGTLSVTRRLVLFR
ncbi:MAG: S8 family serine peptidase [Candidatus Eisenbacteria bacterium]|nr:S8 family serine peptidase [Candidatus Eisenbacteria bacterium]